MPRPRHAVRPVTGVLATVVLALAAVVVPAAGPAHAVDAWRVPDRATITVRGHGYGHGHGLSQYGAQRAAGQGLGYRRIVEFYYPGTRWGQAAGKVSVLISADTSTDVVVDARPGLTLRGLATGRSWRLVEPNARRWRIQPASGGRSAVSFKTRRWHDWRVVAGDAQFSAGGRPIRLRTPAGAVQYRGVLRSASPAGSTHEARHRQRAAARQLPPGGRAAGGAGPVAPPRRTRADDRGAHLRGLRAGPPDRRALPDLRHRALPGVRRLLGRAPRGQRRGRGHRPPDPDQGRRPRVHAVLGQQRRVDVGGLLRLPAGAAGPVRRLVGQPPPLLDRPGWATGRSRGRGRPWAT